MRTYKLDLPNSLDELVKNLTILEIKEIFSKTIFEADERIEEFFNVNDREKNLHITIKIVGFHEEERLVVPSRYIVDIKKICKNMVKLVERLLNFNKQLLSSFETPENFYIDLKTIYYIKISIEMNKD